MKSSSYKSSSGSVTGKFLKVLLLLVLLMSAIFLASFCKISAPSSLTSLPTLRGSPLIESDPPKMYHNTLIVDKFLPEDFLNLENLTMASSNMSLDQRIITSENRYNKAIMDIRSDFNKVDWNAAKLVEKFPPLFNCPHFVERVGLPGKNGRWICGLDLYESLPRPQECVIYMINDNQNENDQYVLDKLANRTDCHILNFHLNKFTTRSKFSNRIEVFSNAGIGVENGNKKKSLRSIMKDNGHAWIDMLFLNIDGREFSVIKQFIQDFYEVCPIGQLHVAFHVAPKTLENQEYVGSLEKFTTWFEQLEKKGFRPFHAERNLTRNNKNGVIVQYAFMNIRGKHLLLTGKNEE